ncbi:hypothetical protein BRC83_02470 [Halobacteriales archaeon QS_1_68_17]|nr:MAG: hypothetical protein BRC83_02470 [Halobacteriales archaeon QS_1_68_17]
MPHQCTNCGRTFADGSKEMLSGCPDCGGNKFQFRPADADDRDPPRDAEPPDPPDPAGTAAGGSVARTVGSAASTVRNLVDGGSGSTSDPGAGVGADTDPGFDPDSDPDPEPGSDPGTPERTGAPDTEDSRSPDPSPGESASADARAEDSAQADARSQVVSPEELPPSGPSAEESAGDPTAAGAGPEDVPERDPDPPDLAELRAELNDQFESIKILEPGQYELNLMELYDREEYIIALQEDGRYSIQVPERWHD